MKNFLFTVLLFVVFLSLNKSVLAQIETQSEYKIIIVPQEKSIPLKIETHPRIEQYIKYYQGRGRQTMEIGLYRFGTHERMIKQIFVEEGVPEELSRLNQVEKMWGSSTKILWSFLPAIAPKYGLRKTKYLDETRSFEKATRAMAQYLKFLSNKYDQNWELALAAYFGGENTVNRAVKKAKVANFWSAYPYLPRGTRNFVPNVLAMILIANNPEQYGFANIKKDAPILYELVRVSPLTTFAIISKFSETPIENLANLNPELILGVTPPEPYVIRVPFGKGQMFADKMRKFYKNSQENQ